MPNPSFPDHFSGAADGYAIFRPVYPDALIDFLVSVAPSRVVALEFGCGSGQLTQGLRSRFEEVIAVDASAEQVAAAPRFANVQYRTGRAEEGIEERRIADLIVVAQAVHWFDFDEFYRAVRRAARPGAILALVSYGRIVPEDEGLRRLIDEFYDRELACHWPAQRRYVEEGYRTIPFPFEELATPSFAIEAAWTVRGLIGYLDTWSAVRSLERSGGRDRFERFAEAIGRSATEPIATRFPLATRIGRLPR